MENAMRSTVTGHDMTCQHLDCTDLGTLDMTYCVANKEDNLVVFRRGKRASNVTSFWIMQYEIPHSPGSRKQRSERPVKLNLT